MQEKLGGFSPDEEPKEYHLEKDTEKSEKLRREALGSTEEEAKQPQIAVENFQQNESSLVKGVLKKVAIDATQMATKALIIGTSGAIAAEEGASEPKTVATMFITGAILEGGHRIGCAIYKRRSSQNSETNR